MKCFPFTELKAEVLKVQIFLFYNFVKIGIVLVRIYRRGCVIENVGLMGGVIEIQNFGISFLHGSGFVIVISV
jgi:hypothetical protein